MLIILPNSIINSRFDNPKHLIKNVYETNVLKQKIGGEIIQENYMRNLNERIGEINSGEMTYHANTYIIPLNFTIDAVPEVNFINPPKKAKPALKPNSQKLGFLINENIVN